jgi:hypothetical protein
MYLTTGAGRHVTSALPRQVSYFILRILFMHETFASAWGECCMIAWLCEWSARLPLQSSRLGTQGKHRKPSVVIVCLWAYHRIQDLPKPHNRRFHRIKVTVQQGLVLRRFTFTTLVESDRALTTCGASLSQLKRPLVLSLLSALLALFRRACTFFLAQFF